MGAAMRAIPESAIVVRLRSMHLSRIWVSTPMTGNAKPAALVVGTHPLRMPFVAIAAIEIFWSALTLGLLAATFLAFYIPLVKGRAMRAKAAEKGK